MKTDYGNFPRRIEIELTNRCNLNCSYCPRHYLNAPTGFMDGELFQKIADEAHDNGVDCVVLHRRGESLLHPDFDGIVRYVKGKFRNIQIATNATLLNEKRAALLSDVLTFISFSLDLPEKYNVKRGGVYKTIAANIDRFLKINKNVQTQVSMVKTDDVKPKDIERFKDIWFDKVDRVRVYEEHSKDGKFGSLGHKRTNRKPCVKLYADMLIYWNGAVGRCNHDWESAPLGNIRKISIKQLWNSEVYQSLRKQHEELNIVDEPCKSCDSWYEGLKEAGTGLLFVKNK